MAPSIPLQEFRMPTTRHPRPAIHALALAAASAAAIAGSTLATPAAAAEFTWTSGVFVPGSTAPEPLPAGDLLRISGTLGKSFAAGSSFGNDGTVAWLAGAGGVSFGTGAAVANRGLWDAQGNAGLFASGTSASFSNSGTLRKSGGTGTSSVGNSADFSFSNSGSIEADTGTLSLGGLNSFLDGTVFSGAGVVSVGRASSFAGSIQSQNLLLASTAATAMTGNAAVLQGTAGWTGGRLEGGWTVAAGATLNGLGSSATGNKAIGGAGTVVAVDGTLRLDSFTGIGLADGATLQNNGRLDLAANGGLGHTGGADVQFANRGVLSKLAGSATTVTVGNSSGFGLVNSGRIVSESGTLQLHGSNRFEAGTVITGAGRVSVNRASSFTGAIRADNLDIGASASVAMTGVDAVLSGQVGWTGGNLVGSWTIAADGRLDALGSSATGNKAVTGALLTNHGLVTLDSATGIGLYDGATIANQGLFDIRSNADIRHASGAAATLRNHGVLRKSGGTGLSTVGSGDGADFLLVNLGTIDAQSGTLRLTDGFSNDGVLSGTATLQVNGGLMNHGTLAPGSLGSGGTLTLAAALTQATDSSFDVDIGSLAAHDRLVVTGTALLNGTLALHCLGACSLAVGDSVTILSSTGTLAGSFAGVSLQGFASGAFDVVYDRTARNVSLRVTQAVSAVPEPATTALWLAGLGMLGFMARRRA